MHTSASSTWPPRRSSGGDASLWGSGILALVAVATLGLGLGQPPGGGMLAGIVLASLLGAAALGLLLWAVSYRNLTYVLGADALEVAWLGGRLRVPYAAIDGIYAGQRLVGSAAPSVPAWPGIYVGPGRARGVGRLRFYATSQDPAELTLVTADGMGIVLSARDPQAFRTALIQRVQQVGEEPPPAAVEWLPATRAPWTALRDRWAPWSLGVAALLLLVGLAMVALRYQDLPEVVPLRFDASGRPSEVGSRADLLRLPLGGFLILAANWGWSVWLHAREALLARLVWVATAAIEAILLVAVIRLLQ